MKKGSERSVSKPLGMPGKPEKAESALMVSLSLSKEELLLLRLPLGMPGKPEEAEDMSCPPNMDWSPNMEGMLSNIEGIPLSW